MPPVNSSPQRRPRGQARASPQTLAGLAPAPSPTRPPLRPPRACAVSFPGFQANLAASSGDPQGFGLIWEFVREERPERPWRFDFLWSSEWPGPCTGLLALDPGGGATWSGGSREGSWG